MFRWLVREDVLINWAVGLLFFVCGGGHDGGPAVPDARINHLLAAPTRRHVNVQALCTGDAAHRRQSQATSIGFQTKGPIIGKEHVTRFEIHGVSQVPLIFSN